MLLFVEVSSESMFSILALNSAKEITIEDLRVKTL